MANYIKQFNKMGIDITYEDLVEIAGKDGVILKPHFTTLLYNKGYIKTLDEAYTKFFDTEDFKKIFESMDTATANENFSIKSFNNDNIIPLVTFS